MRPRRTDSALPIPIIGWLAGIALVLTAGCHRVRAQDKPRTGIDVPGYSGRVAQIGPSHQLHPERRPADAEHLAQLRVPAGFTVGLFATGLQNTRMLAVSQDGTVYVSRDRQRDVLVLRDTDHDGRADTVDTAAAGLDHVNGIELDGRYAYFATPTRVWIAERGPSGSIGSPRVLVDQLPQAGRHPNRTLGLGPDGWLYVSVGSSCNACIENHPESATILRVRPDGTGREIFARGLRNTIGFDWHPVTGQLWGMDQGVDERGDDAPPEEVNLLKHGGDYGWPWCFGDRLLDPKSVRELSGPPRDCRATEPMALGYTAHAAPMTFRFYHGTQFPAEYRGDAFVAMHGSWNRVPPSGYQVVRLRFRDGRPLAFEPFLTGFLVQGGAAQFGRPVGLAVTPDGALLVSEDANGMVYRITWHGTNP